MLHEFTVYKGPLARMASIHASCRTTFIDITVYNENASVTASIDTLRLTNEGVRGSISLKAVVTRYYSLGFDYLGMYYLFTAVRLEILDAHHEYVGCSISF